MSTANSGSTPRLDRPLAQQVGAEAVDGADVRLFEAAPAPRRGDRAPSLGGAAARARSSSSRSRSFSSPAAFSVKVTATISRRPSRGRSARMRTMRLTSSVVLPVPAAASTTSVVVEGVGDERRGRPSSAGGAASRHLPQRIEVAELARAASLLMRRSSSGPHTGRKSHHVQARSPGAGGQEPELDGAVDDLEHLEAGAPVSRR